MSQVSREEFDKLEERMLKITKVNMEIIKHMAEAIELLNEELYELKKRSSS